MKESYNSNFVKKLFIALLCLTFFLIIYYMSKKIHKVITNNKYSLDVQGNQVIGSRDYQEDFYFIEHIPNHITVAAIFDGHGGALCSRWLNTYFKKEIRKNLDELHQKSSKKLLNCMLSDEKRRTQTNINKIINMLKKEYQSDILDKIVLSKLEGFEKLKKMNDFLYEFLLKKTIHTIAKRWDKLSIGHLDKGKREYRAGSTLSVVLVVGYTVHIAYVGDSRIIFVIDDEKVINSTKDHKPDPADLADGMPDAFVRNGRVNGVLGVGRAIGDNGIKLRGAIKRTPDYISYEFKKSTRVILGSDGLYDKLDHNSILKMSPNNLRSENFVDNTTMIKIKVDVN